MYICIVYDMECSVRVLILFLIYIMNPQLDTIFSFSLEQEQLGLLWNTELHQGTSDIFNGTICVQVNNVMEHQATLWNAKLLQGKPVSLWNSEMFNATVCNSEEHCVFFTEP